MSPARVALFVLPLLIACVAVAQDSRPQQSTELFSLPHEIPTDVATHFNALRAVDATKLHERSRFDVSSTGHVFLLDSERKLPGQLPLQYGDVFALPGRVTAAGCYSMRAYRYARDEKGSDVTTPVGYTTCTLAKKFTMKSADIITNR